MKKFLALLMAIAMIACLFAGCKPADNTDLSNPDNIADEMTSQDGKYQVAFITDVGQLKDKSFNQGTYDGVKLYAAANGKSYKYYQPANANEATDADRIAAFELACQNGAEIVVAAGFMQEAALKAAAEKYPDVHFVFIDGYPIGFDNVAPISFQEEQSGYLAGYAAVMEGYTKLGFMGGGGGTNPACQRFGYGFAQGAQAAAAAKNVQVELKYSWAYGGTFSSSPELQSMATGWYQNGTEVIFCCGGSMFQSVVAAASAEDAKVVGVDVDQSFEAPNVVITSAMKGLADATVWALTKHYEGKWSEIGGVPTALGAKDNAVGLPTATWSLKNWTVDAYNAMFADIVSGKITVDATLVLAPESSANVTVSYIEYFSSIRKRKASAFLFFCDKLQFSLCW